MYEKELLEYAFNLKYYPEPNDMAFLSQIIGFEIKVIRVIYNSYAFLLNNQNNFINKYF